MVKEKEESKESSKSMKDSKQMDFYPEWQNIYGITCCNKMENCQVNAFKKEKDDYPCRA